jgi:apolipoprotein D and lipocalin family protein
MNVFDGEAHMTGLRAILLAAVLVGAGVSDALAAAPQPARRVDMSNYSGRWYEIARIPNRLQRGCVAAHVDYTLENQRLRAVQRCAPVGDRKARVYRSSGRILDPGVNAKARLTFAGFWSQEYWIIDHTPDWALVGDPSGRYLWMMSRRPSLPQPVVDAAVARIRGLGYDAGRLEFAGVQR